MGFQPRMIMKALKLLIFLSFLLCAAGAWAQEEVGQRGYNTIFFRANNSYQEDQYDAAIKDYERLINAGLRSANIYYNLGNTYFRTANKGKAILYYERAFRMRPRDENIRANLGFARKLVEGIAQQDSGKWYRQAFFFLRGFVSVDETAFLVFVLYFAAMLLVSLSVLIKAQRKIFYYSAAVCGFLLIIVLPSFIGGVYESEFQQKAVIEVEETAIRFEPDEDATVHFKLYEGAVIQITRSQGEWHQVRRGDGKMGWLRSSVLSVI